MGTCELRGGLSRPVPRGSREHVHRLRLGRAHWQRMGRRRRRQCVRAGTREQPGIFVPCGWVEPWRADRRVWWEECVGCWTSISATETAHQNCTFVVPTSCSFEGCRCTAVTAAVQLESVTVIPSQEWALPMYSTFPPTFLFGLLALHY